MTAREDCATAGEMVTCPQCGGTGGPPDRWDDEIGRWECRVCSRCSGSGTVWRWDGDA